MRGLCQWLKYYKNARLHIAAWFKVQWRSQMSFLCCKLLWTEPVHSISTSDGRNSTHHVVQIRLSSLNSKKKKKRVEITLCSCRYIFKGLFHIRNTLRQRSFNMLYLEPTNLASSPFCKPVSYSDTALSDFFLKCSLPTRKQVMSTCPGQKVLHCIC